MLKEMDSEHPTAKIQMEKNEEVDSPVKQAEGFTAKESSPQHSLHSEPAWDYPLRNRLVS